MVYSKTLTDNTGGTHPRKNMYLLSLAEADPERIKTIRALKKTNSYNIKLKEFKAERKLFQKQLKEKLKNFSESNSEDREILPLKKKVFSAEQKQTFYKDFIELSYDAVLEYKIAELEIQHITELIKHIENLKNELSKQKEKLIKIDEAERLDILQKIKTLTLERKQQLDNDLKSLAEKKTKKLISKKAYKTESKAKKRSFKDDITSVSFLDTKMSIQEEIKNLKYRIKTDIKTKSRVLEADISAIRRKTPIELEHIPLISYFTFLIPGLGQLFNKQYVKAALFFLGTVFIYVIAVPYILGFTNYQGGGITGLINLAGGGAKIDKSIIFMIEGIISLLLTVFSVLLYIISFKDVRNVELNAVKGIRRNTWFESKRSIEREGFPYLISFPALIIIVFIIVVPILTTVFISFTNMDPTHQNKFSWIGLQNYKLLAAGSGIAGKAFYLILGWTLIWTVGASTLSIAIGFILSLIVNQERIRGKAVFRTIYLLPWAVPAFITIMFFSIMVSRGGLITELIEKISGLSLDIKNNAHLTRTSLILLQSWLGSSYIFLLSTGVLQGIPKDLYEAADIDGATGFQKAIKITVPLVLFQTAPLLIIQYAFNFNNFSIIYLFNLGGPFNPSKYGNLAGASDILISYIYKLTIENQYQAIGAAVTMVISLVLMFIAFLNFKRTKSFKEN
ncbi:ABC transporter permease subunit [Treponema pedis]|uniref:ABC transporter permease subunit n=1 Tax=Treponema pedis TaxID=409322 RepID=A0A7S6WN23_9SPIR|nr:sugar ABC transporter permease [Treponema pedis]QOW60209.1 ABC transporter permease subunit [Treponema pedis]